MLFDISQTQWLVISELHYTECCILQRRADGSADWSSYVCFIRCLCCRCFRKYWQSLMW